MRPALLSALLLASAAGCVCPYVLPPTQIAIGSGVNALRGPDRDELAPPLQIRAAVHPMGLVQRWHERLYDVGAGMLVDVSSLRAPHASVQYGPYLEGGMVIAGKRLWGGIGRLAVRAQGRVLWLDGEPGVGGGGALQLTGEWAQFVDRRVEGRGDPTHLQIGLSHGELATGFYVEAAGLRVGSVTGWSVSAGLLFRLPAGYGVNVSPCGER